MWHAIDIQEKWIPFIYLNIGYTAVVLAYLVSM
jgi:hypothetical protein